MTKSTSKANEKNRRRMAALKGHKRRLRDEELQLLDRIKRTRVRVATLLIQGGEMGVHEFYNVRLNHLLEELEQVRESLRKINAQYK